MYIKLPLVVTSLLFNVSSFFLLLLTLQHEKGLKQVESKVSLVMVQLDIFNDFNPSSTSYCFTLRLTDMS